MVYWLMKEEPSHYSFDQLVKDGRTVWDGVRNNLALKHLRNMRKGDRAFFYHTGKETALVGIMQIASDPYPDPKLKDSRMVVVDVVPERKLHKHVTLSEIKADKSFAKFELVRIPRLSVMPIAEDLLGKLLKMAGL